MVRVRPLPWLKHKLSSICLGNVIDDACHCSSRGQNGDGELIHEVILSPQPYPAGQSCTFYTHGPFSHREEGVAFGPLTSLQN